jgi:hypothetical protein
MGWACGRDKVKYEIHTKFGRYLYVYLNYKQNTSEHTMPYVFSYITTLLFETETEFIKIIP